MKKHLLILLPLTLAVSSLAQGSSARLTWQITPRDSVSSTHEATETVTNTITGEVTNRVHRYVELNPGLNYLDESGQWVKSEDLVELTPDGGALAVRGPMKLHFNPNLNTAGGITFSTPSNRVFRTRPLAIVFHNASSGATALVAPLQDCAGELLPPNQVVYKSAFGALADIRLTYTKATIESDLVLLQKPRIPAGWDPRTTRLELWHEWLDAPTPRQNARLIYRETDQALRSQMLEPDLTDQMLNFGELLFPTGAAYWTDGFASRATNVSAEVRVPNLSREAGLIPVAKTWLTPPNFSLLIEAVRWEDIQPLLRNLPEADLNQLGSTLDRLQLLSQLPGSSPSQPTDVPIKVANTSYHPAACVLDYITVSYPFANYTYETNTTYYVTGGGVIDGSTFSPGCVFKFAPGAGGFLIYGYSPITFNGSSSSPVTLTARDDDTVGVTIDGLSDGCPSLNSSYGIYVYYADDAVTLNGLRIRWAQTGVQFDANEDDSFTHTFADSLLEFCEYGLYVNNYANVSVQNSNYRAVTYPEAASYYEATNNFSGEFLDLGFSLVTSPPEYQVVPDGGTATYSVTGALPCMTYQWYLSGAQGNPGTALSGATGTSLTVLGRAFLNNGYYYRVVASSAVGTAEAFAKLVVLDSPGWTIWTNYIAHTNGKSIELWSTPNPPFTISTGLPPTFAWNQSCLLYGMTGFTALSPFNEWGGTDSGVFALTKRHIYMRGHGAGSHGFYTNLAPEGFVGSRVWFYAANNDPVTNTVAAWYNRNKLDGDGLDYTILILSSNLPNSITPLAVMATPTNSIGVLFKTCQHGSMSANLDKEWDPVPFFFNDTSKPPFNSHPTHIPGDSGRPSMIPIPDGSNGLLVFVWGSDTDGPSGQMQTDMNTLSTYLGLNVQDYQLNWHTNYP